MSSTTPIAEWLEGHAGKQGLPVRFPTGEYIILLNFRLYPVDNSSAKTIQMKSSMAFIQSNGWTEIDLIFKKYGGGFNDERSALTCAVTQRCNFCGVM